MRALDWAIVAIYLVWMLWDGLRRTKKADQLEGEKSFREIKEGGKVLDVGDGATSFEELLRLPSAERLSLVSNGARNTQRQSLQASSDFLKGLEGTDALKNFEEFLHSIIQPK